MLLRMVVANIWTEMENAGRGGWAVISSRTRPRCRVSPEFPNKSFRDIVGSSGLRPIFKLLIMVMTHVEDNQDCSSP